MMITLSFLLTYFVVQYPPSILEGMNGIMLQKERQRAEDARLIHRYHLLFQILQTLRILLIHQSLHHQYAVGGGLDALRLQLMDNLFCFHLFFHFLNPKVSRQASRRICNPSLKKVRPIKPGDLQSPIHYPFIISAFLHQTTVRRHPRNRHCRCGRTA